jgi:hypothetical protein
MHVRWGTCFRFFFLFLATFVSYKLPCLSIQDFLSEPEVEDHTIIKTVAIYIEAMVLRVSG